MDTGKELKQRLLPIPTQDIEATCHDWEHEKCSLRRRYIIRFAFAQVLLILLYAGAFRVLFSNTSLQETFQCGSGEQQSKRGSDEFVYTPAQSVDTFQRKELNMHLYKQNPYKGPPNKAVDDAWAALFSSKISASLDCYEVFLTSGREDAYIRLSEEELMKLDRNSTLLQDGSGDYVGALDMYHQLHCVYFIFQYVHQDYYTMRKINVPQPDHLNHCVDVLRQVVMCYADTSISTMHFYDNYYKTWPEFKFQHSCRDWDAVDRWAGQPSRAVNQSDPKRVESWLRNPDFVDTGDYFDGHGED